MYSKIVLISSVALFIAFAIVTIQTDLVASQTSWQNATNSSNASLYDYLTGLNIAEYIRVNGSLVHVINGSLCISNITVTEWCQRCAKITKSPIIYPMCCHNEDDVYNWCVSYVGFGRQPDH